MEVPPWEVVILWWKRAPIVNCTYFVFSCAKMAEPNDLHAVVGLGGPKEA